MRPRIRTEPLPLEHRFSGESRFQSTPSWPTSPNGCIEAILAAENIPAEVLIISWVAVCRSQGGSGSRMTMGRRTDEGVDYRVRRIKAPAVNVGGGTNIAKE